MINTNYSSNTIDDCNDLFAAAAAADVDDDDDVDCDTLMCR